ncbi:MAG TPA: hydroxymethylbilane synthase [Candidatus Eisenbacteria bacterium]|nr:hydroxymethylbilane synthase [Candidatus Eisenbacteria bacterium]
MRVGTRGSALARRQADLVAEALAAIGIPTTIEIILTAGDRRAPDTEWGEGAFVGAIEAGLIDGSIDIAVHSAKDLPTAEEPALRIAAYLPRADPRDVLVIRGRAAATDADTSPSSSLDLLPHGSRVGTDSPRRAGFLRALRPDLEFHPLHGNVDTRLRRLDEGATDALVLAAAGLIRLGRSDRIAVRIPADLLPPAPGQGALAIQVRASDTELAARLAAMDDPATRVGVEVERALLAATGGGCRTPVGALASVTGSRLELLAGFASSNLPRAIIVRAADDLGRRDEVVRMTLQRLADEAVRAIEDSGRAQVIVAGGEDTSAATRLALVDRGVIPVEVPAFSIEVDTDGELERVVRAAPPWDWVVVSSANAVRALAIAAREAGCELASAPSLRTARWAAVGRSTAAALGAAGIHVDHRPTVTTAAALGVEVPLEPGMRVLLPRSDLADNALPRQLAARGAVVEEIVAYRTVEAPTASRGQLRRALERRPAAVALSSASAVRGLLQLAAEIGATDRVRAIPLAAIGQSTAAELRRFGLEPAAIATTAGPGGLADAVVAAIHVFAEVP